MWATFADNFGEAIELMPYHAAVVTQLTRIVGINSNNILLAGPSGFPIDLLWEEAVRRARGPFKHHACTLNNLPFTESPHFIHIDLGHPDIKDEGMVVDFIRSLIQSRCIEAARHLVVIREIHKVRASLQAFKVLVERFASNVCFVCTTHQMSAMDSSLTSRFMTIRVPLPTPKEMLAVWNWIDNKNKVCRTTKTDEVFANSRNLTRLLLTNASSVANYPPLPTQFAMNMSLESVRELAYTVCKYNLSIAEVAEDLLLELQRRKRDVYAFIHAAAKIDVYLAKTLKGREPLYMELLILEATRAPKL